MKYFLSYLAFIIIVTSAVTVCAQQTKPVSGQDERSNNQPETKSKKDAQEKGTASPALIYVKANRERIYAILSEEMKGQKFTLTRKDDNKIVFSQRAPGAKAAVQRKQFDRTTATPIVDDPKTILAFIVMAKEQGFVVAARMIITTIYPGSQVASFDVSGQKEVRVLLNNMLEKLKSEVEK